MDLMRWAELGVDTAPIVGHPAHRGAGADWLHVGTTCRNWRDPRAEETTTLVTAESRLCGTCWGQGSVGGTVAEMLAEGEVLESALDVYYNAEEEGWTTGGFAELYHTVQTTATGAYRPRVWAAALRAEAIGKYHAAWAGQHQQVKRVQFEKFLAGRDPSGQEALLFLPETGAEAAITSFGRSEVLLISTWWVPELPAPGLIVRAPREVAEYLQLRLRYVGSGEQQLTPSVAVLEDDSDETIETAVLLLEQEGTHSSIERALQTARALREDT